MTAGRANRQLHIGGEAADWADGVRRVLFHLIEIAQRAAAEIRMLDFRVARLIEQRRHFVIVRVGRGFVRVEINVVAPPNTIGLRTRLPQTWIAAAPEARQRDPHAGQSQRLVSLRVPHAGRRRADAVDRSTAQIHGQLALTAAPASPASRVPGPESPPPGTRDAGRGTGER